MSEGDNHLVPEETHDVVTKSPTTNEFHSGALRLSDDGCDLVMNATLDFLGLFRYFGYGRSSLADRALSKVKPKPYRWLLLIQSRIRQRATLRPVNQMKQRNR